MAEGERENYKFLRVKLGPGLFDNELTVILSTEGRQIESVVPKDDVEIEIEPSVKSQGRGFLRVRVLASSGGLVLIDLPRPSFTSQPRLRVPEGELVSR